MRATPDVATLPLGAHLVTRSFGYDHHGIYVGAGRVVHYAGLSSLLDRGPVQEVLVSEFSNGRLVSIEHESAPRFPADVVAERARSRLGENRYRLVSNNCEHFCAWCVHGESRSRQVERVLTMLRAAAILVGRLRRLLRIEPVPT